jgi:outer membrane protein OmpA-like peptidoglycan-associated protein
MRETKFILLRKTYHLLLLKKRSETKFFNHLTQIVLMAEINIEPKEKKGPNWLWILGIALLAGLVIWLLAGRNNKRDTVATTTEQVGAATGMSNDANSEDNWRNIDLNAPVVDRSEIKISSPDFETRGNDQYTIYSMGENLLFDTDKATLRSDAKNNLDQIAASLKQRYNQGQVRIYGHADATAGASYNRELSEQRAEAVKNWLTSNANIDASRISIQPMGESAPVASNQTEKGRQMNRRVEIVAMNP